MLYYSFVYSNKELVFFFFIKFANFALRTDRSFYNNIFYFIHIAFIKKYFLIAKTKLQKFLIITLIIRNFAFDIILMCKNNDDDGNTMEYFSKREGTTIE